MLPDALSSAGSALGGAELLTEMMSFNPTARWFHAHGEKATNVQSAVIGWSYPVSVDGVGLRYKVSCR